MSYSKVNSNETKIISGISKVIDGDTIHIGQIKIRFYGIDAPEQGQICKKDWVKIFLFNLNKNYNCGKISTNKLKNKIDNKFITCKWKNKDQYKRFIAECYKDKLNINAWMVQNGYAVAYTKYTKKFLTQQNIAKKNKLGLWSGTFEMPWDWRKKK